jgi:ankyrin repeat protein
MRTWFLAFAITTALQAQTPLHDAAARGHLAAVNQLLKAGANPNVAARVNGVTPLSLAAVNGDAEVIETLLRAGADANAPLSDGTTPLMTAASSGSVPALRALIEHGASIDAKESHGQTALMFAAGANRAAAIRFLVERGANTKITTNVTQLGRPQFDEDGNPIAAAGGRGGGGRGAGRGGGVGSAGGQARGTTATVMGGMTALLLAARNGHQDAVRALLESGADVNEVSAGDKSSPLVIAICNGHYDVAAYLLGRGTDPNLATIDGLAALYATEDTEFAQVGWAPNPITAQEKTGYLDLLKLLLAHGANPNAQLTRALWFRPTSHNEEWIDKKGATAFWRAALATDVAAMKILIEGGADPKVASGEGVTPLMVAAGLGWGANASRTVPDGWLPAVKYLVEELGADVNATDIYNYTALHGAAYRGDNEVVSYLAAKGAKLDIRSKKGQTVTDMANGPMVNAHLPIEHPGTIALLEKLGAPAPEVPEAAAPKAQRKAEQK